MSIAPQIIGLHLWLGEISFTHLILDTFQVSARLKPRAKFWYRAQVHSLIHSPHGLLVRVFLLDYGELSEPVNRGSCIRSLPQRFKVLPPPMAIQVVLPGN